jgi:3'-phosphoadenosine 5'-phosphosulfate sulfotransferase (PAPS reductase)/FAD synthetase
VYKVLAMAIMAAKGDFPPVDCAIFADTGYEPKAVYKYLDFLKKILPYPIHIVAKGNIKDDMLNAIGKWYTLLQQLHSLHKMLNYR